MTKNMISYDEAIQIIEDEAKNCFLETEEVSLSECEGRVLSSDLFAREDHPSFSNSAMDGFALRNDQMVFPEKLLGQIFKVTEVLLAGSKKTNFSTPILEIMTGAPIPENYTTVIKIEDVEVIEAEDSYKKIKIISIPQNFKNIRHRGSDIRSGDLLLKKGTLINTFHLVSLGTQGIMNLPVYKKQAIGIISTGDELVSCSKKNLETGEVRNTSLIYLDSALKSPLSYICSSESIRDSKDLFKERVLSLLEKEASLVVTTGAVSMGKMDFIKEALMELGAEIFFHKVKIRPGKPILFAKMRYCGKLKYFFGIPGNPVSTMVGTTFFVKPFIQSVFGLTRKKSLWAKAIADFEKVPGLTCLYRAVVSMGKGNPEVFFMGNQLSYVVSQGLEFNAWTILDEKSSIVKKGEWVEVVLL